MRFDSIRSHLQSYSLVKKRATTVNHAFASALAPCDIYDDTRVIQALSKLGQDPHNLICVYCLEPAQTWDHLFGLVRDKGFSGYGHTMHNLVPACRDCNSKKGSRPWRDYLASCCPSADELNRRAALIESHSSVGPTAEATLKALESVPKHLRERLSAIREQILELMTEADSVAAEIRNELRRKSPAPD